MLNIAFSEYQILYADVASEEEFMQLYKRAEYLLRGWTARRIDDVKSESDYRFRQAKAAIIHTIHSLASSGRKDDVISVSNDGYSETYASAKDRKDILYDGVFYILSGTGLMGCM